jgi:hypothetical protein
MNIRSLLTTIITSINGFTLTSFIVLFFLHLLFVKRSKILIDMIAVYTSFALVVFGPTLYAPVVGWFGIHPFMRIALFVLFVTGIHIILSFSNIKSFSSRVRPLEFGTSIVYRIGVVGLLFATGLTFAPASVTAGLSPVMAGLFANKLALLIWFCLPFVFVFSYRFKTRRGWIE